MVIFKVHFVLGICFCYVLKVFRRKINVHPCTCVAHVIAEWCVMVDGESTCIIEGFGVMAGFGLGGWCSVCTQISRLH